MSQTVPTAGPQDRSVQTRAWTILVTSAVFEAVWALALGASDGLTKLVPAIIFVVATAISMVGLAIGMKHIPVGTAYAVWTGIGAALTVAVAMLTGAEPVSVLRLLFLAGIVGCVIGLRLAASADEAADSKQRGSADTESDH